MVQFFNAPAVATLLTRVRKQPSLLAPRIWCRCSSPARGRHRSWSPNSCQHFPLPLRPPAVADIDFQGLRREGVRAVAFDKDNTLTTPYAAEVHPTLHVRARAIPITAVPVVL